LSFRTSEESQAADNAKTGIPRSARNDEMMYQLP
jgi:hypothetical protein